MNAKLKLFLSFCIVAISVNTSTLGETFTVFNTGDSGQGSLRQALIDANNDPDHDVNNPHLIIFNDNDADGVDFTDSVKTIFFYSEQAIVDTNVLIVGPAVNRVLLDARFDNSGEYGLNRFFEINQGASLSVENMVFQYGEEQEGGAIANEGSLIARNCEFLKNHANWSGGGILNMGFLEVYDCSFSENSADDGGGIYNISGEEVVVSRCTFINNTVRLDGGGIRNALAEKMYLTNCTFSSNHSEFWGGGMSNWATDEVVVVNCTFSGNFAEDLGGGIMVDSSNLTLVNTIVANSSNGGDVYNNRGSIELKGVNLVEDQSISGTLFGDPGLLPLAENGGKVKTHALARDSIAIDQGANDESISSDDSPLEFDARGFNRFADPEDTGDPQVDLGAVEIPETEVVVFANLRNRILPKLLADSAFSIDDQLTGATPSGGEYLYNGNIIDIFDPGSFGIGFFEIEYVHETGGVDPLSEVGGTFRISVSETSTPLIVNTDQDIVDHNDGLISLREAMSYASYIDNALISFNQDPLEGVDFGESQKTIYLSNGELLGDGSYFIFAPPVGLVIDAGSGHRILKVTSGSSVGLDAISLANGTESSGDGGAVCNLGEFRISTANIYNCSATNGGAIYSEGKLTLADCTLYNNSASNDGGGVYQLSGDCAMHDCTFSSNVSAERGGGAFFGPDSIPTIGTSTINDNTSGSGGGVFNQSQDFTITSSIIANSTGGDLVSSDQAPSSSNCLVQDGSLPGALVGDPELGPLQNNGGLILTHAPSRGSIVVDVYINLNYFAFFDARGFPRKVDSDNNGVEEVDIGAVELPSPVNAFSQYPNGNYITSVNGDVIAINDVSTGPTNTGGIYLLNGTPINSLDPSSISPGDYNIIYRLSGPFDDPLQIDSHFVVTVFESDTPLLVTTDVDVVDDSDGLISLREAIENAAYYESALISFNTNPQAGTDFDSEQKTIYLNLGELAIATSCSVVAPQSHRVVIDARSSVDTVQASHRVIKVEGPLTENFINVTLENLIIQRGRIAESDVFASRGGGISLHRHDTVLNNCAIRENESIFAGGGIYKNQGGLVINNCQIENNQSSSHGGGIYIGSSNGSITINNTEISGNLGNPGGGIYAPRVGDIEICLDSCSIFKNHSESDGGGVYMASGNLYSLNSTFSENTAQFRGGAVNLTRVSAGFSHSTVYNNSAELGCVNFALYTTDLHLTNSIVANSSDDEDIVANSSSTIHCFGGNFISDGSYDHHSGVLSGEPMLDPLADNGGAVRTHALVVGSTAIDAGDNSLSLDKEGSPLITDARGLNRVSLETLKVDLGAFELQAEDYEPTITSISPLSDSTIKLEITALSSGANFELQYSSDLVNWDTAATSLVISDPGSALQWIDDGTQTSSHPSITPKRFYRINIPSQ